MLPFIEENNVYKMDTNQHGQSSNAAANHCNGFVPHLIHMLHLFNSGRRAVLNTPDATPGSTQYARMQLPRCFW